MDISSFLVGFIIGSTIGSIMAIILISLLQISKRKIKKPGAEEVDENHPDKKIRTPG